MTCLRMLSTARECAGHATSSTAAIAAISWLVHCGRMDVILVSLTNGVVVGHTQGFTIMSQVGVVDMYPSSSSAAVIAATVISCSSYSYLTLT